MARIRLADEGPMDAAQQSVYDRIVAGPRGRVVGPLRAVLLVPELADRWQRFGEQLRYHTSLPGRISELAIVTVARRYNSQVEWAVHAQAALDAGINNDVLEAIRDCRPPGFASATDRDAYEYTRQLLVAGDVDIALHEAVCTHWGETGAVELTALIGYYAMVAMMLNAQDIPTPDGSRPLQPARDDRGQITLSRLGPARAVAGG